MFKVKFQANFLEGRDPSTLGSVFECVPAQGLGHSLVRLHYLSWEPVRNGNFSLESSNKEADILNTLYVYRRRKRQRKGSKRWVGLYLSKRALTWYVPVLGFYPFLSWTTKIKIERGENNWNWCISDVRLLSMDVRSCRVGEELKPLEMIYLDAKQLLPDYKKM